VLVAHLDNPSPYAVCKASFRINSHEACDYFYIILRYNTPLPVHTVATAAQFDCTISKQGAKLAAMARDPAVVVVARYTLHPPAQPPM
jgi:hypothetical protein